MSLFADMNDAYKQYWGAVKPGRTCVAVKQLPLGTDVEIECQAVVVGAGKAYVDFPSFPLHPFSPSFLVDMFCSGQV